MRVMNGNFWYVNGQDQHQVLPAPFEAEVLEVSELRLAGEQLVKLKPCNKDGYLMTLITDDIVVLGVDKADDSEAEGDELYSALLDEEEDACVLNCGCRMFRLHTDSAAIKFCPMHEAAEEMKTAMVEAEAATAAAIANGQGWLVDLLTPAWAGLQAALEKTETKRTDS